MAKKRTKQVAQEDLIKLIHPDIGFDEPDDIGAPKPKSDAVDYQAMITAMQTQMDTVNKQLETLHRTNMALMAQPVNAPQAPKVQEFSMEGLPDPSLQPTEYAREVNRRVQESIRSQNAYQVHQQTQAQSAKGVEEALWEKFQEVYSDYSGDQKKVKYVAEQVLAEAQKRGIDVNRYVTGAQDVFLADVAREYDSLFGKPKSDDDDDDDDDDDNRTAGMFGGVPSGGRPTTPAETEDDMFIKLRERKMKEGWY